MSIKTPQEIAEQAAQALVAKHDIAHEDGETALEALCWELGSPVLGYVDGINALVAAAIKADRAQRAVEGRELANAYRAAAEGDSGDSEISAANDMADYLEAGQA